MQGFVYILANDAMRGLFKVGCTSKQPGQRAAELSSASGVPVPFRVLCFSQFDGFQRREQELHRHLASYRPSDSREFFKGTLALKEAAAWLHYHPGCLGFEQIAADFFTAPHLLGSFALASLDDVLNPWKAAL